MIKINISSKIRDFVSMTTLENDAAENALLNGLKSSSPFMVARYGANEIKAMIYPELGQFNQMLFRRLMRYDERIMEFINMREVAGLFPADLSSIDRFASLMRLDSQELNILASWRPEEWLIKKYISTAVRVKFRSIEPYFNANPWTLALEGKRVLVIHPFNKTIESQYGSKRKLLFKDARVLPEFSDLQTIRAVQSLGREQTEFNDWFQALDFMKTEIDKCEYDIAIIGAGAYGFPLAAHVKRKGKKAIHLGGATQILFGIKGKRWVENSAFRDIINEHFVYPSDEDRIKNSDIVEKGCYW